MKENSSIAQGTVTLTQLEISDLGGPATTVRLQQRHGRSFEQQGDLEEQRQPAERTRKDKREESYRRRLEQYAK
jgi:hypothetical protein